MAAIADDLHLLITPKWPAGLRLPFQFAKRKPVAAAAGLIVLAVCLLALLAPIISPYGPDDVQLIAQEIVRADALERVHIGLDYFDASINRIGAYVVGARAVQLALLFALLEPTSKLKEYEEAGKYFERLALLEIMKTKPFGAVYDYYCLTNNVAVGEEYVGKIVEYESSLMR